MGDDWPSKIGDVAIQMQDNLNTVLQSLTLIGAPEDLRDDVINQTMGATRSA